MKYLSEEDEQHVAEDFQGPPGGEPPFRSSERVRALAEELWSIGYAEKCRVNKVKPTVKFYAEDLDRAQHAAWLKIAEHVLQMKRPNHH